MLNYTHEKEQNQQNLWSPLELSLSKTFNVEASKDKPHPNAEYDHKRKKKGSGPSIGGSRDRKSRSARHAKASTPFSIRLTPADMSVVI